MRSIRTKLTVILVASTLLAVALVGVSARWITSDQFDRLRIAQARSTYVETATSYYSAHDAWAGVADALQARVEALAQTGERPAGSPGPDVAPIATDLGAAEGRVSPEPGPRDRGARWSPFALVESGGTVVAPGGHYRVGEPVVPAVLAAGTPVMVGGSRVGTVLTVAPPELRSLERVYLRRTGAALLFASVAAGTLALLLGLASTRLFLRPIRDITQAIRGMRGGEIEQRVPVRTRDEFGEMARAFNDMSSEVARGQRLRRQMTADIAHELRTPLSVLGGYLEAIRDGVLEPDRGAIDAMYEESTHLQRLVDDLRTLSLADAGELRLEREPIRPTELLLAAQQAFTPLAARAGVTLEIEARDDLGQVDVDATRIRQVLGNLIANSLRYTHAGGRVRLSAERAEAGVTLSVSDDGEGIAAEDLPHIFERFYRADPARPAASGASGLGLAIVRSLVAAHGGDVRVESTPGQGTTVRVILPATPATVGGAGSTLSG